MRRAQAVFLEADARAAETEVLENIGHARVQGFDIGFVDHCLGNPRIARNHLLCKRIEHDDRVAFARPYEHEAAHGAGDIEMARQRPW